MEDFKTGDAVWHVDTGIEWHIKERGARDDEPPIKWIVERWLNSKLIQETSPQEKLTKLQPPIPGGMVVNSGPPPPSLTYPGWPQ
jgi:hypothetical protein